MLALVLSPQAAVELPFLPLEKGTAVSPFPTSSSQPHKSPHPGMGQNMGGVFQSIAGEGVKLPSYFLLLPLIPANRYTQLLLDVP